MNIRKVVLGGLVASTAVVLPVSAAGAAVTGSTPPPPTQNTKCTPPKPPAPPWHQYKTGDHAQLSDLNGPGGYGPGGSGPGGYGPGGYGPGGVQGGGPGGNKNHTPPKSCSCGYSDDSYAYGPTFGPTSFAPIYNPPTWLYSCTAPGNKKHDHGVDTIF